MVFKYCLLCCFYTIHNHYAELQEGGSAGISARGPDSQEEACESLKGPIALAIDVGIFNYL